MGSRYLDSSNWLLLQSRKSLPLVMEVRWNLNFEESSPFHLPESNLLEPTWLIGVPKEFYCLIRTHKENRVPGLGCVCVSKYCLEPKG